MANIKDPVLSADVDTQQRELLNTVGGMHSGTDILKNILATCETNVYHVTQQFHKNIYPCKDLYVNAYCSFIHNCQNLQRPPNSSQLVGGKTSYGTSETYNIDKPQKHYAQRNKSDTKRLHIIWFHLCEILEKEFLK